MSRPAARSRAWRAGTLVVVLVAAPAARAGNVVPPPAIPVQVTGCADEVASALPSLVSLEIDVLLRERGATRAAPDNISVRCTDDAAHIEVALAGARRGSTIALGALAPEHRARAVALAAAELVDALSARAAAPPGDATSTPTPAPVAPATPPDEAARAAADASSPRPGARRAVLVGAAAEWLGQPKQALFGARLAAHYPVSARVVPALSLDASFGDFSSTSGQVTARTFGGAAHLYFGVGAGKLHLHAGPGARVGWVQLRGQPPAGSALDGLALSGMWAGPELRGRVAYHAFRSPQIALQLALELGAGVVAKAVRGRADGTTAVYSIDGAWLSACVQAGVSW
jgi:hypothetical protein